MRKSGLLLAVMALAAAGLLSGCNGTVAGSSTSSNTTEILAGRVGRPEN